MLELPPGGRDVGVPALGHPAARELHVALVERRLELQQEHVLLDVEDGRGHDPTTLATRRPATDRYPALPMSSQYIFTMHRLSKLHPPDKTVLDNITLAFYPGAKIGVLGYNGAGKSTLLRIMAGRRPGVPRRGRARARGDASGCSSRSPSSTRPRTSRGNVEDGVAETQGAARPLQRAGRQLLRRDRRGVRRASRRKIDAADAWNLDTQLDYAMDALRLPPPRRRRRARSPAASAAAWRCAGCCCARPTCCCSTSRPTTSTPSRSRGSSSTCAEYKGTIVAVTHDRYFLDNVAGWILELDRGKGIPYEGNYSSWLEQKQARLAQEERSEKGAPAHDRRRARVGAHEPQGPAHEVQGAPRALRGAARRGAQRQARRGPDPHPAGPAPGRPGARRPSDLRKGFGERLLIEDLSLRPAARRDRRRDRRQRRRQDDAVPHDHRARRQPDAGTLELGDTVAARLRRPVARRARPGRRPSGRRSPAAYDQIKVGDREVNSRQYAAGFNFKGSDQQATHRQALGRRAQPRAPGQAAAQRRQPAAARRAHERPRRRHAARARGRAAGVPRLRGGDLPRPLVPGPHRHARARVRGRLAGDAGSRATSRPTRSTAASVLGAAADRPHRITYKRLVRG